MEVKAIARNLLHNSPDKRPFRRRPFHNGFQIVFRPPAGVCFNQYLHRTTDKTLHIVRHHLISQTA